MNKQINPIRNVRRPQVGAAPGYYGTVAGYSGYGTPQQTYDAAGNPIPCAPACAPSVIGNAGAPGCGTGTAPGQECGLRVLFRRSAVIAAGASGSLEALAGRSGAFKPRSAYMVGIADDDPSVNARFEIANITVMGTPQLINFDGVTNVNNRGLTDFYNLQCMPQPVDWDVFGSSQGQGLQIEVVNPDPAQDAILYVAIWGDAASADLLAQR